MNLGILGTGMIVQDMLQMSPFPFEEASLLGTERSREKALALVKQYGLKQCFFDYGELLDSGVDTVYVALPNHLHFAYTKEALLQGKHVIVEKPAVSNLREWDELETLAAERGVMLFEAVTLYHLPAFQALKDTLPQIGTLKIVSLNYSQYSSRYDAFQQGELPPVFDWRKSGGALMDINLYNLHALLGLFGAPERVLYSANIERGIDTSGILLADYPGFRAVCVGAKDCTAPACCTFQGDRGAIRLDGPVNGMTGFTLYPRGGTPIPFQEEQKHRMLYEFLEFSRCIRENDQAACRALLERSRAAACVLDQAREQAGIRFAADES